MRDAAQPLEAHLRRGSFHRVNRAEQTVDLFGIVVAFQRKQAIADDLQVLFGFRLEELQNLVGHFVVPVADDRPEGRVHLDGSVLDPALVGDRLELDIVRELPGYGRDERREFWREGWKRCAELGVQGLPVPAEFGGKGEDLPVTIAAMEGLGYGCPDNGLIFAINASMWTNTIPILRYGSEDQKRRFLPGLCDGTLVGANGASELIVHGETGFVVADPWNLDEWAERLGRLVDDAALRTRMGARARAACEQMTIEVRMAELNEILQKLRLAAAPPHHAVRRAA